MTEMILGIDLGTSGCKILALNTDGTIAADRIESYPSSFPKPGWSEQNPADWANAVFSGIKKLLSELPGVQILAVGLSGQMHGLVALDAENRVIRPAILWNDQRTQRQCEEITRAAGGLDGLVSYTNNQMMTGFTGGKILWVKENEPENYRKIAHILNPKDYIRFLLTDEYITDVSEASGTGLFDVKNRCFSRELIEKLGFNPSHFPKVVESTAQGGAVTARASEASGLPVGCMVSGGGGDAVISTTGLGLVKPGRVGITVGTSGVVAMGLPKFMDNPGGRLQVSCGNAPGTWHAMGAILSAAGAYDWFVRQFGKYEKSREDELKKSRFRQMDEQAASTPPGAEGMLFLPYLIGERCPVYDSEALGGFFGVTGRHTAGHFARSVMEGVAFALRQTWELLCASSGAGSDEIVLAGGGAVSPVWRQIFADSFGIPVRTVYGSEQGGSFAAALVAGVTAGVWLALENTVPLIATKTETFPDSEASKIYETQYEKYKRLYDATKWLWK